MRGLYPNRLRPHLTGAAILPLSSIRLFLARPFCLRPGPCFLESSVAPDARLVPARYPMRLFLCLLLLVSSVNAAIAGQNAQGKAWLSWDRAGSVRNLGSPARTSFPLYLQLRQVVDMRALAVHFTWSPYDSTCHAFTLQSASSANPALAADSLCGLASSSPPHAAFAGDSTYTWSISFPPGSASRTAVAYLVSPPTCGTVARADFLILSVFTMDSNGAIDTLGNLGGATIRPTPTITAVVPNRLSPSTQIAIRIHGANFRPGASVSFSNGTRILQATNVAVEGDSAIAAQIALPAEQQGPLDLSIMYPGGLRAFMLRAVTVTSSVASATTLKPTDDPDAYRRLDLSADELSSFRINYPVNIAAYPDSLQNPTLLVRRNGADTVAIFNSTPHAGVGTWGFEYTDCFARYNAGNRLFSNIGVLVVGGIIMNGPGGWNDYGKPLLKVITRYSGTDSLTDSLRVGIHARNYQSGTLGCGNSYPTYTALPSDPLCGQVWAGTQSGAQYFYDVQELRLPVAKRRWPMTEIELRGIPITHYPENHCGQFGTSTWFGVSLWNKFTIANAQGAGPVRQSQGTPWGSAVYGGYRLNGVLYGARRTLAHNACLITCMSMIHNYYGVSCTPVTLNTFLQDSLGYARIPVAEMTSLNAAIT